MFSSTRLNIFVCIALGIAVSAAPAGSPHANIDARSPDIYDGSGGLAALLLGLEGEGRSGDSDEDVYILKRDVYDLDGGLAGLLLGLDGETRSGENSDEDVYILKRSQLAGLGLADIAGLREGGLKPDQETKMEARSPDVYDGSGGLAALLLGLDGEGRSGDSDEDVYILKRDVYDLGGGLAGLLLGLDGETRSGGNSDEDVYILKRSQLAGLDLGSHLNTNMGLAHAAGLGQDALGLNQETAIEARSPDVYDLGGGLAGLVLGLDDESRGGDSEEDVYILKRDVYDLDGGVAGLLLGLDGENYGEDSDEDVYILKRQLEDPASLTSNTDLGDLISGVGLDGTTASLLAGTISGNEGLVGSILDPSTLGSDANLASSSTLGNQ